MNTFAKQFRIVRGFMLILFAFLVTLTIVPPKVAAAQATAPDIATLTAETNALNQQIQALIPLMAAREQQLTAITQQITTWQAANPNTPPSAAIQALIDQQQVLTATAQQDLITLAEQLAQYNNKLASLIELRNKQKATLNTVIKNLSDTTPPAAEPSQAPAANAQRWNRGDVTIQWNWRDSSGSNLDPANCPPQSTSNGEGEIRLTAACRDLAGNIGNATYVVRVDKTPPSILRLVRAEPNPTLRPEVSFEIRFNERVTGLEPNDFIIRPTGLTGAVIVKVETPGPTAPVDQVRIRVNPGNGSGTLGLDFRDGGTPVTDEAGNRIAQPEFTGEIYTVDRTPPSAAPAQSPAPNAAGWNNTDVVIAWNWRDNSGGAGIDAGCRPSDLAREGVNPTTAECRDKVGNLTRTTYTAKVDRTRPTISAAATIGGTAYTAGAVVTQDVTVSFSCADALSGIAICPPPQQFTTDGSFTASGTATDNAGNSATITFGPIQLAKGVIQGAAAGNGESNSAAAPAQRQQLFLPLITNAGALAGAAFGSPNGIAVLLLVGLVIGGLVYRRTRKAGKG